MQITRKIGPGPIVYGNGADWQSGMSLPMPNLSKFKRLVWPKFMLPNNNIPLFFSNIVIFPAISLLEESIIAKI